MANIAKTAVELDAKTGQYQAKMSEAAKHTKSVFDKMSVSMRNMSQLASFSAISKGFTSIKNSIMSVGRSGKYLLDLAVSHAAVIDVMNDMSEQTGISTESLSKLSYVAKLSGTSIDAVRTAFKTFGRVAGEEGFRGDIEEKFMGVITTLGEIPDRMERAQMASKWFGKSWLELGGMIANGEKEWAKMISDAERFGIVISSKTAAQIASTFDKWDMLKSRVSGVGNALVNIMSPKIEKGIDRMMKLLDDNAVAISGALEKLPVFIESTSKEVEKLLPLLQQAAQIGGSMFGQSGQVLAGLADIASLLSEKTAAAFRLAGALYYKDYKGADQAVIDMEKRPWLDSKSWTASNFAVSIKEKLTPLFDKVVNAINPLHDKTATARSNAVDRFPALTNKYLDILGVNVMGDPQGGPTVEADDLNKWFENYINDPFQAQKRSRRHIGGAGHFTSGMEPVDNSGAWKKRPLTQFEQEQMIVLKEIRDANKAMLKQSPKSVMAVLAP